MPAGGTALRSIATLSLSHWRRNGSASNSIPGAPAAITTAASSSAVRNVASSDASQASSCASGTTLRMSSHTCWALRSCRDATRTLAPSRASSRTTRWPTEPVAASTVTVSPASWTCFRALKHRGGRGRVRAVGIEHHRDAHRAEEAFARFGEQLLAGGDVGAADEDRRVFQIGRSAREHRAVHKVADGVGSHVAMAQQLIRAGIDRDHGVEHARLRVGVETERGFWQVT